MKPRLFVGSSSEGRAVALAIQQNLERHAEVTLWDQGIFELTHATLESLIAATRRFDFAVFAFTADDLATIRGKQRRVARDNVVFELGLFLGSLGRQRTYVVVPHPAAKLHLPTDLLGVTVATYEADRSDGNDRAALGPACATIELAIRKLHGDSEEGEPPRSPFVQVIADHAGIRTARPHALALDLLTTSTSIRPQVEAFLAARGWSMPIEELNMPGLAGSEDVALFAQRLQRIRRKLGRLGATEVHLFIAGPLGAAALAGASLSNWIPVKFYQRPPNPPPEVYEYFAPLVKA